MCRIRIVDGDTALTEVAQRFSLGGHCIRHGVRGDVPVAFVVKEEEGTLAVDRAAQRGAEVVLHQMVGDAHVAEGMGVECAITQELVDAAMELAGAGAGRNIDLTAACSAHLG